MRASVKSIGISVGRDEREKREGESGTGWHQTAGEERMEERERSIRLACTKDIGLYVIRCIAARPQTSYCSSRRSVSHPPPPLPVPRLLTSRPLGASYSVACHPDNFGYFDGRLVPRRPRLIALQNRAIAADFPPFCPGEFRNFPRHLFPRVSQILSPPLSF